MWVLTSKFLGIGVQTQTSQLKNLERIDSSFQKHLFNQVSDFMTCCFLGELVPNDIVLALLKDAILKNSAKSNGFLIDGYPREESQGREFEKSIAPVTVSNT